MIAGFSGNIQPVEEWEAVAIKKDAAIQTAGILNLKGNQWQQESGAIMHRLSDASLTQIKWMARGEVRKAKQIFKNALRSTFGDYQSAWVELAVHLALIGIAEPEAETVEGKVNRVLCTKWWRRRLRVKQAREQENKAIDAGLVKKSKQIYVSDQTVARRRAQRGQNDRILENLTAINDLGQEYKLYDLAQLSISNPQIRRAELMTRISGFEQYSKNWGDVGEFYTITCPSKMHSSSRKYDGTTPKQAQAYLSTQWQKIRAKLNRKKIEVYGFRVVEPHHDGCPHWHLLLFMDASVTGFVRSVLKSYALEVDGSEAGAEKHRFKAERILTGTNPKTGGEYSAAGYIAKYISKAIDGYGVDFDLFGNDAQAASARIEAWASTWGIRQFQQIGGASVTVWRELRRLRDEEIKGCEVLERARACADAGDWAGYLQMNWNGQIDLLKKDVSSERNQYGEPKMDVIYGVKHGENQVITRQYSWEIGVKGFEPKAAWTRVNNCTLDFLEDLKRRYEIEYYAIHYPNVQALIRNTGVSESVAALSDKGRYIKAEIKRRHGEKWGIAAEAIEQLSHKFANLYSDSVLIDELIDTGQSVTLLEEYKKYRFREFLSDYFYHRYGIYFIEEDAKQ